MSYLLDFIKTFTDEEKRLFAHLDVKGKEELIRDEYLRYADSTKFDELNVASKYKITQKHLDKIVSILLDKSIQKFYQNNDAHTLQILYSKGLSQLLIHELKIMERKVEKSNIYEQKVTFYKLAFETLCRMYHPNFQLKLTQKYGDKYLVLLGKKAKVDDAIYTDLLIHQANMIAQCFAGNENKYREKANAGILKWEKEVKKTKSVFILFFYHYIQASYIKFYGTNVAEFNSHLEKALYYLKDCTANIQEQYLFKTNCELGFGNTEANQFEKAYLAYKNAFKNISNSAQIGFYHPSCYLNVCIINNKLQEAEQIFDKFLAVFLHKGINKSLQFDVLVNALILQLHTQHFSKAFVYLSMLKAYKKNEISRVGQLIIRICENLYFYCTSDFSLALTLAQRNIKFLNRPENKNEQFIFYIQLFECIAAYSKNKLNHSAISVADQTKKQAINKGMYGIYVKLLK